MAEVLAEYPTVKATFNFVPSLITMLLGLIVGEILRTSQSHGQKLKWLAVTAVVCLVAGLAAHYTVCPIVKRIWTPSWALASGAAVIGMLMLFYVVIDVGGWKRLGWPLAVARFSPSPSCPTPPWTA